jgi:hypothetical protein
MLDLIDTRLSLHTVAELLLAGPQFAQSKTIKLCVTPGGFATTAAPDVRVDGTNLVVAGRPFVMHGRTVTELAADAGVVPRRLDDVYADGSGLTEDHELVVDQDCAAAIAEGFLAGERALAEFAPGTPPVMWPEHFDIGISLAEVNYGVSPGDAHLPVPYAYVSPWAPGDLTGDFWNTSFGAARPLSELDDLVGFFADGRALAGTD